MSTGQLSLPPVLLSESLTQYLVCSTMHNSSLTLHRVLMLLFFCKECRALQHCHDHSVGFQILGSTKLLSASLFYTQLKKTKMKERKHTTAVGSNLMGLKTPLLCVYYGETQPHLSKNFLKISCTPDRQSIMFLKKH